MTTFVNVLAGAVGLATFLLFMKVLTWAAREDKKDDERSRRGRP